MKILMLHPHDLYSLSEPWTIRIKNIAREFLKKGHSVKLVYFPLNASEAYREFPAEGIELVSLDRRLGIFVFFRNLSRVFRLAEWADVIHFQKCYYYVALPALLSGWLKKKHLHYDWDDWETKIFYYSNPRSSLRFRIVGEFLNIFEKLIPRVVDTVSVSSGRLRELCIARGVPDQRIFPAPVGADIEKFDPSLKYPPTVRKKYGISGPLVLYVGQLHGGQYVELFIKAAAQVLEKFGKAIFMIVGDGYRLPHLKELAVMEKMHKYLIFTGAVSHDEIPGYMAEADVCVACFEDNDITRCKSPLKIVEYMSMGKAVVASNVGEVRRMLGGIAVLVPPGDSHALADGITKLLSDRELRGRLGTAARERAEKKYNWTTTALSLLSAYETGE